MNLGIPDCCPVCGGKLEILESKDGVKNLFCVNEKCPSRFNEQVSAFCERLGIMGVSNTTLKNWGITTIKDIVDFEPCHFPGHKSEVNFANELDKKMWNASKESIFIALSALVYGVGRREMKKFWDTYGGELCLYGQAPSISEPSVKEQTILDNLEVVKDAWDSIIGDSRYKEPVEVEAPKTESTKGSICFTGKLETMTRSVAQEKARNLGYEIAESVAKGLGTLVVADAGLKGEPSSKLKKAQKLGIKIMSESEFNAL